MKSLNFALVAHVDHGKSTLSACLIEIFSKMKILNLNFLDNLAVEREKNITVRTQAINLFRSEELSLNLLDTPGHADFASEVIKSLVVSDFILLMVSLSDGLKSQTMRYYQEIRGNGLPFFWVISKVDLGGDLSSLVRKLWDLKRVEIFLYSHKIRKSFLSLAKFIKGLLMEKKYGETEIKERSAYVLGSFREPNVGYHLLIKNLGIPLGKESLGFIGGGSTSKFKVRNIYVNSPLRKSLNTVLPGEISYLITSLKEPLKIGSIIGDQPIKSHWIPKHCTQNLVLPETDEDYFRLWENLKELRSNDFNFNFFPKKNLILGNGFLCKASGALHMEVIVSRLLEMSTPVVSIEAGIEYRITLKNNIIYDGESQLNFQSIVRVEEEFSRVKVVVREDQLSVFQSSIKLPSESLTWNKGNVSLIISLESQRIIEEFESFIRKCSGYMNYEILENYWLPIRYLGVDFYLNDVSIGLKGVFKIGDDESIRKILRNLLKGLRRQESMINLQAKTGQKVIASEKVKAFRKDVASKVQGGRDTSRKAKLLDAQKRGKKKLKESTVISFDRKLFIKKSR